MSVQKDDDISVKEYNEISKYKDLETEIEKNVALKNYHYARNGVSSEYDQERD